MAGPSPCYARKARSVVGNSHHPHDIDEEGQGRLTVGCGVAARCARKAACRTVSVWMRDSELNNRRHGWGGVRSGSDTRSWPVRSTPGTCPRPWACGSDLAQHMGALWTPPRCGARRARW